MKNSAARNDITVFDFNEEDEVPHTYHRWSQISNPISQDPSTKYQFLQYASTASITQTKGDHTAGHVHVVAIDDDDDDIIRDITPSSNILKIASAIQSEELDPISDGDCAEHCVNPESSCPDIGINVSRHFRSSGENGLISVIVPDSPSSSVSADARTPDDHDTILDNYASTSTSPIKENSTPIDIQDVDQPVSSLEMEEADTIILHTDYAIYRNRYYAVSLLLFSKNCVKLKASCSQDEPDVLEWKVDNIVSIESHWSGVDSTTEVKIHFSIRDARHDGNAQDPSVVEVLEFLLCEPRWPWRQECIISLHTRYKIAWSIGLMGKSSHQDTFHVDDCSSYPYIPIFKKPFEVVYPEGDVDAVSISMRDVDLLQPETFINDTIIDFYIKYLKNQILPQDKRRFHFFNSFFFRKLADLDKNQFSALDSKTAFQRVRKWTKKVDIFTKDYIFIPVNYNLHWSLIVICHPGEVAKLNRESNGESLKVPCILHMDSIRGSHKGLKNLVQSYLLEEWKERREETSEDIVSNFLNLRFLSLELPQQENSSDCGLFLLHYVELFIAEAPANFNPFMINGFQNFLKPDWFMPSEASLKRVHIQRLIYKLLESHFLGSTPSFEDHSVESISQKMNQERSGDANLSHSQSVQGLGTGLLDMSLCGNPGLRDHSQQCDEQLRFHNPPIGEEEVVEHVGCSTSVPDQPHLVEGAFHSANSSRECKDGFTWNLDLSDHEETEAKSLSISNHSSDDSQEMEIIVFDPEKHKNLGRARNVKDVDSLTESYDSASSETMEIGRKDSQEMDNKNNRQDQREEEDEQLNPNPNPNHNHEEVLQNQSFRDENDEILVVEDSSSDSDEEQAAKRIRLDDDDKCLSEEI